ncbi:polysaccharide biosynthesis/export family protein [Telmatospirillum sp.]|uniref:polysaccharide biosynthesis/export family protein n=1 Tax=Telmatospirillum sp. TaxID=2079197 RepID=UPI0028481414|nr:polysaccharide biosynthesis/export family protein [Telmatospirillum sp.]MDR3439118.1 polysaccharide export protein [Telmatospirillum sp.]
MKKFFCAAVVVTAMMGCTPSVAPEHNQPERFPSMSAAAPEYRIAPGDELSVVMPFNPELNYEGPVGPDGRFTMPVVGTVPVGGLSVPEAGEAIDSALVDHKIARAAHSSVSIRHYAQVVYVGGEVKLPGAVPLRNRMDPLQAIAVAGGLLDTARSEQVVLIRPGADGKPLLRTVDLDALIHTGDPTQAVALQPQDTIFVPRSSIAEVDQWIDQYINRTLPFNRSVNYTINQNAGTNTTTP